MTDLALHDDEIPIDVNLVRQLVDHQFPAFKGLPVQALAVSGSTNRLFRLGDDLLVRLPRQPGNGAAIDKERRWVDEIRRCLPVSAPEIVEVGLPELEFDEPWSIVRWIEGDVVMPVTKGDGGRVDLARDLAAVITAMREHEVSEAAVDDPNLRWYRGRPLAEFDKAMKSSIEQCRSIAGLDIDLDLACDVWDSALTLPGADKPAPDAWYHADLVAENLLVVNGQLQAVLDWGVMGVGDPTIDLHGAWELFDGNARAVFREELGVDDAQWLRGRAWALGIAMGCFSYYWGKMPGRCRDRLVMARSVLADFETEG